MIEELKPCPFCGAKPRTFIEPDGGCHIRCWFCGSAHAFGWTEKKAAEKWNRRAIADVAPIKHAKWIDKSSKKLIFGRVLRDRIVQCDQCRNYLDMDGVNGGRGDANYCPNCGARMDAKS